MMATLKHCNLEETKKLVLKVLSSLRKEIRNADELDFEINKEVFSSPNPETWWFEHGYNGKMNFSIHIYSKKNDERLRGKIKQLTKAKDEMERLNRDELLKELLLMNELTQGEYSHSFARQKRNHQACRQIDELIMNYDMVKQYRDEKEAEQAETELTYIEIILDLYERISDLCKQLEAKAKK